PVPEVSANNQKKKGARSTLSVISFQKASGPRDLTDQLVSLCDASRSDLIKGCPKEIAADTPEGELMWATALALVLLIGNYSDQIDEWEMIAEKGTKCLVKNLLGSLTLDQVVESAAAVVEVPTCPTDLFGISDLKQNDKHWYNACSLLVLSCSKFLPQLARGYLWPVPGNQFMASENKKSGSGVNEVKLEGNAENDAQVDHIIQFASPATEDSWDTDARTEGRILLHRLAAKNSIQEKQGDVNELGDNSREPVSGPLRKRVANFASMITSAA
ncbi:hypothetical protein pdam_00025143, partial [Pocillopora damicornis]